MNATSRFCGQAAPAQIALTVSSGADPAVRAGDLQGAINVTTSAGKEDWLVELQPWPYRTVATTAGLTGQYKELLAEFAFCE